MLEYGPEAGYKQKMTKEDLQQKRRNLMVREL